MEPAELVRLQWNAYEQLRAAINDCDRHECEAVEKRAVARQALEEQHIKQRALVAKQCQAIVKLHEASLLELQQIDNDGAVVHDMPNGHDNTNYRLQAIVTESGNIAVKISDMLKQLDRIRNHTAIAGASISRSAMEMRNDLKGAHDNSRNINDAGEVDANAVAVAKSPSSSFAGASNSPRWALMLVLVVIVVLITIGICYAIFSKGVG